MTKQEQIRKLYYATPHMSSAELAAKVGCTARTARYALAKIKGDKLPAKILLFDLETAPMEVFSWGIWKQLIQPHQVIKNWSLLSWSAKWLFSPDIMGMHVTPQEAHDREDGSIINPLWDLMDQADIVIAHNANKFDVKRMNSRFLLNDKLPPSPYRVIDTLMSVRRTFGFSDNKLDSLNKLLGIQQKKSHEGFNMWVKCVNGTPEVAYAALGEMMDYNNVDVLALEDLYLMLRPWIKSHPNVNLYQEQDYARTIKCSYCGSAEIEWNGKYYTPAGRFKAYRCTDCGAIGRSRYSDLDKEERKYLGLSVAN